MSGGYFSGWSAWQKKRTIPQIAFCSNFPTELGKTEHSEKTRSVTLEAEEGISWWNYFGVREIFFSLKNEIRFLSSSV